MSAIGTPLARHSRMLSCHQVRSLLLIMAGGCCHSERTGSLFTLQAPLQSVSPEGQMHLPPLQLCPAGHLVPQVPQFSLSLLTSCDQGDQVLVKVQIYTAMTYNFSSCRCGLQSLPTVGCSGT